MDSNGLLCGDSHTECFCNSMGIKHVSFNSPSERANIKWPCPKINVPVSSQTK